MKKLTCIVVAVVLLLGGCTDPMADKAEFISFLERTGFPLLIHRTNHSPADIPAYGASSWYMDDLLTALRAYYDEETAPGGAGTAGYFTAEELEPVSRDLLGYSYELLSAEEKKDPLTNRVAAAPYPGQAQGLCFTIDEDSFGRLGSKLTIEAELLYTGAEGAGMAWRMWYQFRYMPHNTHIPYRLLASEVVEVRVPTA